VQYKKEPFVPCPQTNRKVSVCGHLFCQNQTHFFDYKELIILVCNLTHSFIKSSLPVTMILNYLKIATRNGIRQPFFTIINLAGLAIGLAACWFLTVYYFHENSYDTFIPDADKICAVGIELKDGETEGLTTNTPPALGLRLAADYPEIEMTARTFDLGETLVKRDVKNAQPLIFSESNAMAVDSTFLQLFGFEMKQGDANALNNPLSLVVTEKIAQKYFGNESAMGQTISINDRLFTISGIMKDLPSNSSLQFGFLLPTKSFGVIERFSWSWIWLQMDTWAKFKTPLDKNSLAQTEAKFPEMVKKYAPAAFERIGQNFEEKLKQGDKYNIKLLPLNKLHLSYNNLISRLSTLGDGDQVKMFGIIGIIILLLACINFVNLSTARSMNRAKEVGVRKALGSSGSSLIWQFLVESSLMSFVAFFLAALLVNVFLPLFNQLTRIEFTTATLFSFDVLVAMVTLPILTGLFAGLYPAIYLSKFTALKSSTNSNAGVGAFATIRSGLVVFQFSISLILILGSFVVYRQLNFAQKSSVGLNRNNVLVINNTRHLVSESDKETFRQKLLQIPEIKQVTHSTFLPSLGSFGDFYEPEQGDQSNAVVQNLPISSFLTDEYFVPTLKLEIIAGRNFRVNSSSDSSSVILNETAVKAIGWKNPIGKWLRYPGNQNQRFQVIGVMKDFHLASIRTAIEPVAIFHESSKTYQTWGSYMAVRYLPNTEKSVIEKVSNLWKAELAAVPFEYDFLDAAFANLYKSEAQTASIVLVFTFLALFIGCLGLFALATFIAEKRTKEIGIRKVLGATVMSITTLLSKDFLKLVFIAIVIASPIAYYLMYQWLQDFVYRIEISWWMFVISGAIITLIALFTVSYQAIKAALMNPVKSLKTE
jgi:putative ABC transport system permease protein